MSVCVRNLVKKLAPNRLILTSHRCRAVCHGNREKDMFEVNKELAEKRLSELKKAPITVEKPDLLSEFSGIPEEHIETRRVRIYKPAKNAMQSGTNDTKTWRMDFESRERWENPLMGWTSTGDPLSNLNLWFSSKEDAVDYCERNGLTYEVDEPQPRRNLHKSYSEKFSWSKRTRVGSK